MSEFMKNKVQFALALLGTLFVLHPFLAQLPLEWTEFTYDYNGTPLLFKLVYAFGVAGVLLSLSVYLYAMEFISERSSGLMERLGNLSYALAILVLPLFGLLFAAHIAAIPLGLDHLHYTAPASIGAACVIWLLLAVLVRMRLGREDRRAKLRQLHHHEVESIRKARDLYNHHHFDLAIIETWKALEARLHRLLLHRGYTRHMNPDEMIKIARRLGLVKEDLYPAVQHLQQQWNVAVGAQPLTQQAAESALNAGRKLLATLPVEDHNPKEISTRRL